MQRNISIDHFNGDALYNTPSCHIILRDTTKGGFTNGIYDVCIINWMFIDTPTHKAELHLAIRTMTELDAMLATNSIDIIYFISTCEHKNITLYINGELQITGGYFEKTFENNKHLKTMFESKWSEVISVLKVLATGLHL